MNKSATTEQLENCSSPPANGRATATTLGGKLTALNAAEGKACRDLLHPGKSDRYIRIVQLTI